ncbi:MAG: sensor histidine kinase [Candidatus Aminicenantes bacterium]|nr:sensor histidine kinase [Candidatus Aminicenantes bacterium]
MVEDLAFHLMDLVQNAVSAGAATIDLRISESARGDLLTLEVVDDGSGMDRQTLLQAQDPFFTSKSFKKVGLGIPLLKATAQACRGDFHMASRPGRGTRVRARLQMSHIDCPPLGDLEGTLLSLLVSLERVNLRFRYRSARGEFSLASKDIRRQAGSLHFSHPDVFRFLREYIREGLGGLLNPGS